MFNSLKMVEQTQFTAIDAWIHHLNHGDCLPGVAPGK